MLKTAVIFLLISCLPTAPVGAEELYLLPKTSVAPEIDTLNKDIRGAISAWQRYLAATAAADTSAMALWWNPTEKQRFKEWDFARDLHRPVGGGERLTGRAQRIDRLTPKGHYYEMEVAWDAGEIVELKHLLRTPERWTVADPLTQMLFNWNNQRFTGINFVYPPEYKFIYGRAMTAQRLIDSLATAFALPLVRNVTFYICETREQFLALQGLATYPDPFASRTLGADRVVFSATGWAGNRREAAKMFTVTLGAPMPFVRDGVASYYGGSAAAVPDSMVRAAAWFLTEHKDWGFQKLIAGTVPTTGDIRRDRAIVSGAGAIFIAWVDENLGTDIVYQMILLATDVEQLDRLLTGFAGMSLGEFEKTWPEIVAARRD